ncbi:MAG: phosphoribosylglycinamide formyltransferase [Deltaproteobacteria bacterium]|nr:phosphoribosylglycinamide formyltransferase [Deltaproteobacteria bacterium]
MALPLAILISGSGSNLQSIIDAIEAGRLNAKIKIVISNVADAYGIERARNHGLFCKVMRHTDFSSREGYDKALAEEIRAVGAEIVILAGFMRILSSAFIEAFRNRILNIHPAILPSFAGLHAQAQQADFGVRLAGCTVHFVDEKMDHGPIIIQAVVPAFPDDDADTLGKRILAWEHRIYPQAIQWLAEGRLETKGRKVILGQGTASPAVLEDRVLINPPLEEGF